MAAADRRGAATAGAAEHEAEAKLRMLKGAAFLTAVASGGLVAGFGSSLALAKKHDPAWFSKGVAASAPEGGASVALRALGWGSLLAWGGVALLSLSVWRALGVHSLSEFRLKMQSLFPKIPKTPEAAGSEPLDWDSVFKSK
ncbi:transmembrane protein 242 [Pseudoliparis swirei]|uniref:transmembrane protein 242 n=1 Tax=Pseudoliparis swirei TaxID=2059687 RepID=UPI0024BECEFD|nr:transmembrane protein 242 [Pseudoliparis swirei]